MSPAAEAQAFPLLIKQLLLTPLAVHPDQEIVYADTVRFDYRTLHARIGQLAGLLTSLGVRHGDTVAVMDWDSNRYLESYFAVPMIGAVLMTVNIRLAPEQIAYTLNHSGAQVILTRRTETLRQHGGQVGFPGGRTEPDDRDAVAAALRESQEEIALLPTQVQVLGYLDPFVTITGYRVMPVVAVIDPAFVAVPQPEEVAEVFEVPLAYLMEPANLHQVEIDHRGRIRHVLEYAWPGQRIWGATAAILYNPRRRLEQTR
ncbi:MAG TPA: CoA pyrophosphatase [Stenotrophomonas sp.]|nr:CoA pyrophosphatase [Stenotrophomonas sp.]